MPQDRFLGALSAELDTLRERGTLKGDESVIVEVLPAQGERGPRYLLDGEGDKPFLKMNSNNYLGMALRREVIEAEEETTARFGAGPGAVRFISGTYRQHVEL
ncbi:pyridoxal phosphate-dependent aminotransferase family protein, partial [bacterium]